MRRITALLAFASVALLAGCANDNQGAPDSPAAAASAASAPATASPASAAVVQADTSARAHAVLASASGSDVAGTLSFASTEQGVHITGRITGLKPDSTHGFHFHEHGDCSSDSDNEIRPRARSIARYGLCRLLVGRPWARLLEEATPPSDILLD